jgi:hypothetical protein
MQVMYEGCARLDVHKKTVVACVLTHATQETRTFGMVTADLLPLGDWLLARGCTHVVIKGTGDDWKTVFNILEGTFEVLLVNAQHVKAWRAPLVNSQEALVLSLKQPPWMFVEKLSQESPTAVPLPHRFSPGSHRMLMAAYTGAIDKDGVGASQPSAWRHVQSWRLMPRASHRRQLWWTAPNGRIRRADPARGGRCRRGTAPLR